MPSASSHFTYRGINPVSQAGFGAGNSERYDKFRHSYAPEVLSRIRTAVSGKEGLKIVEIGCGSGIFTRALLAHPEWSSSISELKCIDPNEGMRAVFAKTVDDPRVSLFDGTFEDTGVPDGWADLILIAQAKAFHWCSELEDATREFARILKPGGSVGLTFNKHDVDKAPWILQVREQCAPNAISLQEFDKWRRIFDLPLYMEKFFEPDEVTIASSEPATVERVTQVAFTAGVINVLPDEEKAKVGDKIKAIVLRGDGLVWLNKNEGIFEIPIANLVASMRRKPL
ncbi:hypothetical protein M0805_001766 [Coniferiporia weirii]|nr:hypothetical protein M0805_001766 [Coniferiporia weirii]